MQQVSSTQAKQAFGELLKAAEHAPVAIEKHQKIKAVMVSPEFFSGAGKEQALLAERRIAHLNQTLLEKDRLIRHQRIAVDLLTLPDKDSRAFVDKALAVVEQWRSKQLCSQDYIDRWQTLLSLPAAELAKAMTSDTDGWGPALRQNSPWPGVRP